MREKKPDWLKKPIADPKSMSHMRTLLKDLHLNTICQSANCPNIGQCFKEKTATFLILGTECTRSCSFCNVTPGKPLPVDPREPHNLSAAVVQLGLGHVVITSVTRDDLPDKGSSHFRTVITEIKKVNPNTTVETLIPDFAGEREWLEQVVKADPEVIAHNVETAERLYSAIRPGYSYHRSLMVLETVKDLNPRIYTKSNIMVGLGETDDEVLAIMEDLRGVSCDFLTIGQYLQPSIKHHEVKRYVDPQTFERYKEAGMKMGFLHIASGAFVRSSFKAHTALSSIKNHLGQIS
jgi:lipoic acid synthetase